MVAGEVLARWREQGGQLGQKVDWSTDHVALTVWGGSLVLSADVTIIGPGQALQGECWPESIAAQAFDAFAIVLVDGDVGVQRESANE